ncbi:hypothetical protein CL633_01950 [bacterium]|nr:hypothetical protein [bacterium]|tara:strand:- start:2181 stop:2840 length:660 start_codon:yes stop_codon:yes gene_type:complete
MIKNYKYKNKRLNKTSKFSLVLLILVGLGASYFLFNEYYLEKENIAYTSIKSSIYNLAGKIYDKAENMDFAESAKPEPNLIWCRMENCYLIDKNGIVLKEHNVVEFLDLIKIKEEVVWPLEINKKFIDLEIINFITDIQKLMFSKTSIQPKEYLTPNIYTNRLEIISSDNKKFIFNIGNDLYDQFLVINKTLEQFSKEQRKNLKYMGVDIDSQVYYMLE